MLPGLATHIPALLTEAGERLILPRWRQLARDEVREKSPDELVSVVDTAVEAFLGPALRQLVPGSSVVGEEACAENPSLLGALDTGTVWLLDPLDGTRNFVEGREDFGILLALLRHGECVAAWLHAPHSGELRVAERGGGAWRGNERLRMPAARDDAGLRGIVRTRYLPQPLKDQVTEAAGLALAEAQPGTNAAAIDYPALVAGRSDFILYWRTLPWDHAAGVLLVQEAGGHAARLDGTSYRASDARPGLLAARDADTWASARAALLPP